MRPGPGSLRAAGRARRRGDLPANARVYFILTLFSGKKKKSVFWGVFGLFLMGGFRACRKKIASEEEDGFLESSYSSLLTFLLPPPPPPLFPFPPWHLRPKAPGYRPWRVAAPQRRGHLPSGSPAPLPPSPPQRPFPACPGQPPSPSREKPAPPPLPRPAADGGAAALLAAYDPRSGRRAQGAPRSRRRAAPRAGAGVGVSGTTRDLGAGGRQRMGRGRDAGSPLPQALPPPARSLFPRFVGLCCGFLRADALGGPQGEV